MRPGIYDYGAADNLESALRMAANTLEGFITQRGQTAQHDFGYTVNGIIEGWIGNAYNKWYVDFNTSQNVLTNYANSLNQLWVQVHNATYEAEMYMYNRASISQLPVPSPVGNPILAPQNSDPNNAEGATPALLYDYSDLMTALNDQILPAFRTSLPQYVSDYYASYSTTSSSTEPNLIQPIDELYPDAAVPHSIAYYLTGTVRPMDAHVRTVGKAFEKADSNPITTSPRYVPPSDQGDPDADHFITLSSEAPLDQAIAQIDATDASIAQFTADEKAGAQAAKSFKDGGDLVTQQLLDEIIANQNNAAWTSTFFSTLSTTDILLIIQYMDATPGGRFKYLQAFAQACTTALDSGLLTPSSVQNLITIVLHDLHQGISVDFFNQYLFADLKNHPKAAANFINYATDQQLKQLLDGNYSQAYANRDQRQSTVFALLLNIAKYFESSDPAMLPTLVNRVGMDLAGVTSDNPDNVEPSINAFLAYSLPFLLQSPPPGASSHDMIHWTQGAGAQMATIMKPYLEWMKRSVSANNASKATLKSLIEGTIISLPQDFLALLSGPEGWIAAILFSFSENTATGITGAVFQNQIDGLTDWITRNSLLPQNANGKAVAMADVQLAFLDYKTIADLLASGQIVVKQDNPPHDVVVRPVTKANIDAILNSIEHPDSSTTYYTADGLSVADVLTSFNNSYETNIIPVLTEQ